MVLFFSLLSRLFSFANINENNFAKAELRKTTKIFCHTTQYLILNSEINFLSKILLSLSNTETFSYLARKNMYKGCAFVPTFRRFLPRSTDLLDDQTAGEGSCHCITFTL